jgi:voltage-gated potassium channel
MIDKAQIKNKIYKIIFKSNTPQGKAFDIYLIIAIFTSVFLVVFDSVPYVHNKYGVYLVGFETFISILFLIEFILRIYCLNRPWKYILSFFGIIDFLSIIPSLLIFIFPGAQVLGIIRLLRVIRIFRILNLSKFLKETTSLWLVLQKSFHKILIFMMFALFASVIIGAFMYVIENNVNPAFSSIPKGIYWAVVTLTTVGYGDITPVTNIGQFFSVIVMVLGYSIIAVPTGIFSAEFVKNYRSNEYPHYKCVHCKTVIEPESKFCKHCGTQQKKSTPLTENHE